MIDEFEEVAKIEIEEEDGEFRALVWTPLGGEREFRGTLEEVLEQILVDLREEFSSEIDTTGGLEPLEEE